MTSSQDLRWTTMRYPGGKGRCYQAIISMMPPHRVYIETHLGGGAIMLKKRPARISHGVDLDAGVVSSWRAMGRPDLEIHQVDAVRFLSSYPFRGDELVYSDPPYLSETRRSAARLYRHGYTSDQHIELIAALRTLPCAAMISGYRSALYADLLGDWTSTEFAGDSHAGPTREIVWRNFGDARDLHDYGHIGGGFREREAIKRRQSSIADRIGALRDLERRALFRRLAERYGDELSNASAGTRS